MIDGLLEVLRQLRKQYKIGELNKKWRKANLHNFTTINRLCNINLITVGNYTYGQLLVHDHKSKYILSIGNFCSIADDVHFFLAGNHSTDRVTTYPIKKNIFDGLPESLSDGNIIIEDDVWIGRGATIMSGVRIGKGAVVAAGAIVTKDVASYTIVGGVPAKVIKKRFSKDIEDVVSRVDFSTMTKDNIEKKIELFYIDLTKESVENVKEIVSRIMSE